VVKLLLGVVSSVDLQLLDPDSSLAPLSLAPLSLTARPAHTQPHPAAAAQSEDRSKRRKVCRWSQEETDMFIKLTYTVSRCCQRLGVSENGGRGRAVDA